MKALLFGLAAACLATIPAASAASLTLNAALPTLDLTVPVLRAFDWNIFTPPDSSGSTTLGESPAYGRQLALVDPLPSLIAVEDTNPLEAAFGLLVVVLVPLGASLGIIPRFHFYRARWRALNLNLPVH